jgi:hypothetical protein
VLPTGQKLTLGLLVTIILKAVPFLTYAPFPALLPFFKCILELVFCKGVKHRLRFCLNHLICVKMVVFQFCFQSGKHRKVGWLGDNSHVVSGKKFSTEKEI